MTDVLPRVVVEACVDSVATALAAEAAGANRIELCGLGTGGTTPSFGLMSRCREVVRVPIHVMIRPGEGDFVYSADEFGTMVKDIGAARSAAVDGVVFAVLREDGTIDVERMTTLVQAARPLRVACHRAFDQTPDANAALATLMSLDIDIVLTSGHRATAVEGAPQLAEHCRNVNAHLTVMAGGGIRANNVREIIQKTGVSAVHARATDPTIFAALMQQLGRQKSYPATPRRDD